MSAKDILKTRRKLEKARVYREEHREELNAKRRAKYAEEKNKKGDFKNEK